MAAVRRTVLRAFVLCAAASVGACGGKSAPAAPAVVQGDLNLLVLNRLQGFAEAIPCDPGAIAPLAGAVQVRSNLQAEGQTAKLVLVGDTLQRSTDLPGIKPVDVAVRARADVILEALGAAQPDAWIPGAADILGEHFDTVLARCQTLGIPVLMSNVAAPGHPEIKPWLVFQAGTLKVGCLGLLPLRITDPEALSKGKDGDARLQKLEFPGASVLPPAETVERLAAELRAREGVQLVVAFSNLSGKGNSALANEASGLDFIIGSSENKSGADRVLVGGPADRQVAIMSSLPQGEELDHVLLRIVGGDMHMQDTSPAHTLPAQIAHDEAELDDLVKRFGTSDVDELAKLAAPGEEAAFKRRIDLLHENRDAMESYAAITGSLIDQQAEPFADPGPGGPIAEALARQGAAVEAAYETANLKPLTEPEGEPIIPQPDTCAQCHPAQTEFWRNTVHAHAFDRLRAVERQRDPECLKCHAAGYEDREGWVDPRYDGPLGGVTCWSCHRTQAQHAERPRQVVEPRYQGVASSAEMACEKCHNERRSPGFDRAQALPGMSCPPMRTDEPQLLMAWQAALDQIAQRRQAGSADARDDYLQARALFGLQRVNEGLPLLDKVAAANTSDTQLAIEIARLLDRFGQSRHALDRMRDYLRHQSGDEAANWTYADLLLHAQDPAVRDPAQAAQHISLLLPSDATATGHSYIELRCLQVEALFASGRADEGSKLLDVLLRDHASDTRLQALRDKLNAGR